MWKIYDNEKDNNDNDDDGQWKHFIGKAHWSLQLRWSNQLIVIYLCITSKRIFSVHTVFRVYILCCVDIENTLFQKNLILFILISVLLYCHCPTLQCFTLEKHSQPQGTLQKQTRIYQERFKIAGEADLS